MKKLFAVFIYTFCLTTAFANNQGARSAALANASITLSDAWSSFHNQAGLAYLTAPVFGISYDNPFLVNAMSTRSLAFALPLKFGSFACSGSMYGYQQYNEKHAGIAYAKKLGKNIAAGIQTDYRNVFINGEEYGNKSLFLIEGGIIAEPLKNFHTAFHLFNPNRVKLAGYADERIPTIIRLGVSYRFSDKVLWAVEEEKDMDMRASFKSGVEYMVASAFTMRIGIATNPTLFSFGFGLIYSKLVLDVASTYHQELGFSPSASVSYRFQ